MPSLDKILKFVELTHELQKVELRVYVKGKNRLENDLEHQYQLAMLAWYVIDAGKLKLNKEKVLRYALVHDFVEVYAGDTYFYGDRKGKAQRELAAAGRIRREFPDFKDLHADIAAYEKKKDKESVFVYALDKLIPIYNIFLDGGRRWRKDKITLEMLVEKKTDKVALDPETRRQFQAIVSILKRKEKELF